MSKISSLFKDDRTRLAQLDPRTKILLTITVSTILFQVGVHKVSYVLRLRYVH